MYTKDIQKSIICPTESTLALLDGKWKLAILHYLLAENTLRFGELRKRLPGVTQRMLTAKLRELESYGVVKRTIYPVVPPRVEYSLSDLGKSLEPVMDALRDWSVRHSSSKGCPSNGKRAKH
ncbi:MAG TPA: helix-turn-helix domain-containing protein [Candidatus Saccharimonadales bacterium]|nr:helix-turn-helix domain-containing protein [Candidatus Saccharimonadales bacterium]